MIGVAVYSWVYGRRGGDRRVFSLIVGVSADLQSLLLLGESGMMSVVSLAGVRVCDAKLLRRYKKRIPRLP